MGRQRSEAAAGGGKNIANAVKRACISFLSLYESSLYQFVISSLYEYH